MNGNTAIDLVLSRLVRSGSSLRASVLAEMNLLIHTRLEVGDFTPWFLFEDDTSLVTTANDEKVVLPAGFLRFDDDGNVGGMFYKDTNITTPDMWVPMTRGDYNKLQRDFSSYEAGGPPVAYDVLNGYLYLRPIPDGVYELRCMGYFADDDVADAATTTKWLTHAADWVVAEVAQFVANTYLRNYDLAQSLERARMEARGRVYTAHIAQIESMKSRAMGDV